MPPIFVTKKAHLISAFERLRGLLSNELCNFTLRKPCSCKINLKSWSGTNTTNNNIYVYLTYQFFDEKWIYKIWPRSINPTRGQRDSLCCANLFLSSCISFQNGDSQSSFTYLRNPNCVDVSARLCYALSCINNNQSYILNHADKHCDGAVDINWFPCQCKPIPPWLTSEWKVIWFVN